MDLSYLFIVLIFLSAALALLWAAYNAILIGKISVGKEASSEPLIHSESLEHLVTIAEKISRGANAFLFQEYTILTIFIALFSVVIFFFVDVSGRTDSGYTFYATAAFIVGSLTSILCGFIGMRIAVATNYRVTFKAISSLPDAFSVAYQGGIVMGFSSVGIGLAMMLGIILLYERLYQPKGLPEEQHSWAALMELIAAFGLGGSCMALFGRVGGGIYTKAADVGADLVGKVEEGLNEDSPRNPATIADNVGDNVGDIAGMGSDLFGSFAEATCAALVVIATTKDLIANPTSIYFPLLISAGGLVACLATSIFGVYGFKVTSVERIPIALNLQLLLSTALAFIPIFFATSALPGSWKWTPLGQTGEAESTRFHAFLCTSAGLLSGLFIGWSTDYYTSHSYRPVREMASACTSGPAINIIFGLALGYVSTIIPVFLIAVTVLISSLSLGMLGLALAALGMLSTLSVGLAIDAYGPISDNAGGIAEMSELPEQVRQTTDALDAAGNTTAAVGKGFAIGSAALVSLSLYGAFLTRATEKTNLHPIKSITVIDPWIICSLLIGAMLPYAFSALTMKSVGTAAQDMVAEVRRQFQNPSIRDGTTEPDYESCIRVSTKASLKEMILPGILVMFTPLVVGILFHPALVAGLLPGALLSGVMLAISMANTGGAWDNTKKYIESGAFVNANNEPRLKGSDEHKAAVVGDTVGDPLKDTSGPSLNILIKLMAIISLVFAGGFANTAYLSKWLHIQD